MPWPKGGPRMPWVDLGLTLLDSVRLHGGRQAGGVGAPTAVRGTGCAAYGGRAPTKASRAARRPARTSTDQCGAHKRAALPAGALPEASSRPCYAKPTVGRRTRHTAISVATMKRRKSCSPLSGFYLQQVPPRPPWTKTYCSMSTGVIGSGSLPGRPLRPSSTEVGRLKTMSWSPK